MITGGKPPPQWPAPRSWVFPRRKWLVWGKKYRTGPKASAAISPWQLACVWGCWCWQHLWSSCFFQLSCGPTGCRPAAQPAKASSSPSPSSSSSSWWPFGPCFSDRAVPACPECVCTVPSSPRLHCCSPCLIGSSMGSGSWTLRWVSMCGTIFRWIYEKMGIGFIFYQIFFHSWQTYFTLNLTALSRVYLHVYSIMRLLLESFLFFSFSALVLCFDLFFFWLSRPWIWLSLNSVNSIVSLTYVSQNLYTVSV